MDNQELATLELRLSSTLSHQVKRHVVELPPFLTGRKGKQGDWDRNAFFPNSFIEALTPNETVFGDSTLKEVIKVK